MALIEIMTFRLRPDTERDSDEAAAAASEAFSATDLCTDFVALIDDTTIDERAYAPAGAA